MTEKKRPIPTKRPRKLVPKPIDRPPCGWRNRGGGGIPSVQLQAGPGHLYSKVYDARPSGPRGHLFADVPWGGGLFQRTFSQTNGKNDDPCHFQHPCPPNRSGQRPFGVGTTRARVRLDSPRCKLPWCRHLLRKRPRKTPLTPTLSHKGRGGKIQNLRLLQRVRLPLVAHRRPSRCPQPCKAR